MTGREGRGRGNEMQSQQSRCMGTLTKKRKRVVGAPLFLSFASTPLAHARRESEDAAAPGPAACLLSFFGSSCLLAGCTVASLSPSLSFSLLSLSLTLLGVFVVHR